jgi:hypothetical protein
LQVLAGVVMVEGGVVVLAALFLELQQSLRQLHIQ